MGWLQGSRFRNIAEIRQDRAKHLKTEGASAVHDGKVARTTLTDTCMKKTPLQEPNTSTVSTVASSNLQERNDIDILLEATFGGKDSSRSPQSGIKNGTVDTWPTRSFQMEDTPDHLLPFISKDEIKTKALSTGQLNEKNDRQEMSWAWIVVDDIVYDCSEFINDHPGGKEVIFNFVGEDCTWQFWTFHSRDEMEQYGRCLRIGRTADVPNSFKPRPKYVGLSRIGHDEW